MSARMDLTCCHPVSSVRAFPEGATEQLTHLAELHRWAKHDFFELLSPTTRSATALVPRIRKRPYDRRGFHLAKLEFRADLLGKPHIIAFFVDGHVLLKELFKHFWQPQSDQPFERAAVYKCAFNFL